MQNIRKRVPIISASLLLFLIILLFQFRGITYYDEGYILNSALRIAHGQIPYKDFDMVYTPLSYVISSGFIRMFGESVFSGRLASLAIALFSLYALYMLLKLFTQNSWLIFGSLLFFVTWGPTHINFPWPTMFAACFLLYTAYFYMLGIRKSSGRFFFYAGIFTVLVFLSKQNFGGGTLLVLSFAFLFLNIKNKLKLFMSFASGVFSVSLLYVVFLFFTNSFFPFIQNMYLYTVKRVFVDKSIETPFLYEGSNLIRFAKLLFYTSPLLLAFSAICVLPKTKRVLILLPALTCMFYLLGIRPTTDYVHVVPLLAVACLPLAIIITYAKTKYIRFIAIAILLFMTGLGFYTAYFKGYYQWEPPLKDSNYLASDSKLQIFLTEQQVKETDTLINYIKSNTKHNDYLYVNYYAPMIYFITERKNPTPYDLISTNQLPISHQITITELLQRKKVNLIITHVMHINEQGIVTDYVKRNYRIATTIGGYILYEKNQ